jgi:hypothetical protein
MAVATQVAALLAASSNIRAQPMFACSSKRAFTSTSTTTCLPARAAAIRASTTGESPLVRYSVSLMPSTFVSAAACSMNRCTLVLNDWYG